MHRLLPIEGLRAYLAIWVMITHVIFFSVGSLHEQASLMPWAAVFKFFENGPYAVDIFMIISGFVIFLLLDKRRESYGQFILRRFFRLYPIYFILLVTAIATTPFHDWVFQNSQRYLTQPSIDYYSDLTVLTSKYFGWNVVLHLTMLQGIIPSSWLSWAAVYAFIIAAWSISVEWQFYLVAPIIYNWLTATNSLYRILLIGVAFALFFYIRHGYYFQAFLPLFIPFFLLGIASYCIYKSLPSFPPDTVFPIALGLAVIVYVSGNKYEGLMPIVIWIPFLGLLCEDPKSISATLFLRFFTNRIAQFLGGISYGIYLSHELVLMCAQYLLITLMPEHSLIAHFWGLLILTFLGTVIVAGLLHRFVELPGMELGKNLASRLKR